MRAVSVTTEDNPYDPLDEFEKWLGYDLVNGYNTCGRLSSITNTADNLPDDMNDEEIEKGVDFLVKNGFVVSKNGKIIHFKKVVREY